MHGSFFTIVPVHRKSDDASVPEWYSGNMYAMNRAPYQVVDFPAVLSKDEPTTFDIFISGDYEVSNAQHDWRDDSIDLVSDSS